MGGRCLAGSDVALIEGPAEQASGGSMQLLEAQVRLVLLLHGTGRLAGAWKIFEEKEDGEAEHLPDSQAQGPQPGYGRRFHFG